MATYTTHFNLDKYEGSDRPNLRDQYNAAMDKIDGQLYSEAQSIESHTNSITALQAAQIAANARMDNQDLAIDRAENAADQAVTVAQDAMTQLAGMSLVELDSSNFSEWFEFPSGTFLDTSKPYSVTGIGFQSSDGDMHLAFHLQAATRAITTSDYDAFKPLIKFKNYKNATALFYQAPSEAYGDHNFTVELPGISSMTELPHTLYGAIYLGSSGAQAIPNGIRVGINMICHLTRI